MGGSWSVRRPSTRRHRSAGASAGAGVFVAVYSGVVVAVWPWAGTASEAVSGRETVSGTVVPVPGTVVPVPGTFAVPVSGSDSVPAVAPVPAPGVPGPVELPCGGTVAGGGGAGADAAFLARLPALRGGFDTLSPAARDRLLETVEERLGTRIDLAAAQRGESGQERGVGQRDDPVQQRVQGRGADGQKRARDPQGFVRLFLGPQQSVVTEALERLADAGLGWADEDAHS
nr:DUF5682 family protein [Streptomyces tardus]